MAVECEVFFKATSVGHVAMTGKGAVVLVAGGAAMQPRISLGSRQTRPDTPDHATTRRHTAHLLLLCTPSSPQSPHLQAGVHLDAGVDALGQQNVHKLAACRVGEAQEKLGSVVLFCLEWRGEGSDNVQAPTTPYRATAPSFIPSFLDLRLPLLHSLLIPVPSS